MLLWCLKVFRNCTNVWLQARRCQCHVWHSRDRAHTQNQTRGAGFCVAHVEAQRVRPPGILCADAQRIPRRMGQQKQAEVVDGTRILVGTIREPWPEHTGTCPQNCQPPHCGIHGTRTRQNPAAEYAHVRQRGCTARGEGPTDQVSSSLFFQRAWTWSLMVVAATELIELQ